MKILAYYELNIIKQSSSITNVSKKAASLDNLKKLLHRPVRDLAWCLLSPTITHWQSPGESLELTDANTEQWLFNLDKDPTALYSFLEAYKTERLGIYFEILLRFYFIHYPRFELKAHNLQLNQNKLTIGELDFVVIDAITDTPWHIETAVKWYLHRPYCLADGPPLPNDLQSNEWCQWIGPNAEDCLAKKMVSLINKQLKMSFTDEAKRELSALGIDNIKPSLWFKGYLFEACTLPVNGQASPKAYSNIHTASKKTRLQWLTLTQALIMIDTNRHQQCIILPKLFWLSEVVHEDYKLLEILPAEALLSALQTHWNFRKQAQLVAFVDENHQESARYFIDYQ